MVDGIVLAAGFSSRAKTNKMLLDYNNKPLIMNTIETMHKVCQNIVVVTGYNHNEIVKVISSFEYITIAYNKNYKDGMFSSIKTGVFWTKNSFFITPGDYPIIDENTYKKILHVNGKIVVPSYQNKLGHPIYFDKSLKNSLLSTHFDNLKSFRNDYEFKIVEVDDPGILFDVDDLDDYKKLTRKD